MRTIEKRTKHPGGFVSIDPFLDYPLVDGVSAESINYFLKYWKELVCIEQMNSGFNDFQITIKGWDRLDPGSAGGGIPGHVFVAMAFDRELEDVFETGIRPAIEADCEMKAIRIDKVHHNEKICDKILAEIRRSRVVVADFTQHRAGVYFEAGSALGLGRLVIWTCREDAIKDAHFDTRQYPHVVWSDSADLRRRLADRIQALMQR